MNKIILTRKQTLFLMSMMGGAYISKHLYRAMIIRMNRELKYPPIYVQ